MQKKKEYRLMNKKVVNDWKMDIRLKEETTISRVYINVMKHILNLTPHVSSSRIMRPFLGINIYFLKTYKYIFLKSARENDTERRICDEANNGLQEGRNACTKKKKNSQLMEVYVTTIGKTLTLLIFEILK